jgi:hypothetical protein
MADITVGGLTANGTALAGTEIVPLEPAGILRRNTLAQVKDFIIPGAIISVGLNTVGDYRFDGNTKGVWFDIPGFSFSNVPKGLHLIQLKLTIYCYLFGGSNPFIQARIYNTSDSTVIDEYILKVSANGQGIFETFQYTAPLLLTATKNIKAQMYLSDDNGDFIVNDCTIYKTDYGGSSFRRTQLK